MCFNLKLSLCHAGLPEVIPAWHGKSLWIWPMRYRHSVITSAGMTWRGNLLYEIPVFAFAKPGWRSKRISVWDTGIPLSLQPAWRDRKIAWIMDMCFNLKLSLCHAGLLEVIPASHGKSLWIWPMRYRHSAITSAGMTWRWNLLYEIPVFAFAKPGWRSKRISVWDTGIPLSLQPVWRDRKIAWIMDMCFSLKLSLCHAGLPEVIPASHGNNIGASSK